MRPRARVRGAASAYAITHGRVRERHGRPCLRAPCRARPCARCPASRVPARHAPAHAPAAPHARTHKRAHARGSEHARRARAPTCKRPRASAHVQAPTCKGRAGICRGLGFVSAANRPQKPQKPGQDGRDGPRGYGWSGGRPRGRLRASKSPRAQNEKTAQAIVVRLDGLRQGNGPPGIRRPGGASGA